MTCFPLLPGSWGDYSVLRAPAGGSPCTNKPRDRLPQRANVRDFPPRHHTSAWHSLPWRGWWLLRLNSFLRRNRLALTCQRSFTSYVSVKTMYYLLPKRLISLTLVGYETSNHGSVYTDSPILIFFSLIGLLTNQISSEKQLVWKDLMWLVKRPISGKKRSELCCCIRRSSPLYWLNTL